VAARRRVGQRLDGPGAGLRDLERRTRLTSSGRTAKPRRGFIRAFIPPPEKAAYQFVGTGIGTPAVSPDGTRVAFSARRDDGSTMLYVRSIDAATAVPLAGTQGGLCPFWSPDSRFLGYFSAGKLRKIDASGGPPLALADATSGRGGTWSRAGTIVFAPDQTGPLFSTSANGGPVTQVTRLDEQLGESTHRWPQFLPDSKHFLYLARIVQREEHNGVRVGSLDGKEGHTVVNTEMNAGYAAGRLFYARESTLMVQPFDLRTLALTGEAVPAVSDVQVDFSFSQMTFSVSDDVLVYQAGGGEVGSRLQWFDRTGKPMATAGDRITFFSLGLSPDGRRAAVSLIDPRAGAPDIWILELDRGLRTRFTFDPGTDSFPVWTRDGNSVVFSSIHKGKKRLDLYRKSLTGPGEEALLFESNLDKYANDVTPDGRTLVFHTRATGDEERHLGPAAAGRSGAGPDPAQRVRRRLRVAVPRWPFHRIPVRRVGETRGVRHHLPDAVAQVAGVDRRRRAGALAQGRPRDRLSRAGQPHDVGLRDPRGQRPAGGDRNAPVLGPAAATRQRLRRHRRRRPIPGQHGGRRPQLAAARPRRPLDRRPAEALKSLPPLGLQGRHPPREMRSSLSVELPIVPRWDGAYLGGLEIAGDRNGTPNPPIRSDRTLMPGHDWLPAERARASQRRRLVTRTAAVV
jgi:hypothetical protein